MSDMNDVADALGQRLAEELQAQQASNEAFYDNVKQQQEQGQALRDTIVQKIAQGFNRAGTQQTDIPIEVQQIVAALIAQPRFIAPTAAFVKSMAETISANVDKTISDLYARMGISQPGQATQPAQPTTTQQTQPAASGSPFGASN